MIIALEGMEFFARHGVHKEERENGNYFDVNVSLSYPAEMAAANDDLSGTLDYSAVYEIVKSEMAIPSLLLEAVAKRIHDQIRKNYPEAKQIQVAVAKLNPPIGGKCSKAKVTYMNS